MPESLIAALRAAFASDLAEQVRTLEERLVALENAAGEDAPELLREVFRAAHGLKGASRAAGFPEVEAACHAMESILGAARDQGRHLEREDFAAMLATVDALGELQRHLSEAPLAEVDPAPFTAAAQRLEVRLVPGPPPDAPAAPASPAAAPPPPDAPASPAPQPPAPATAAPPPPAAAEAEGQRSTAPAAASQPPQAPTPAPPSPDPARRRTGLRVAPERLDELGAAAGALIAVTQGSVWRGPALDEAVRDIRRARSMLGGMASEQLRPVERMLLGMRSQVVLEARSIRQRASRLASTVRALRLTPWADAAAGLDRIVRDLADTLGKDAEVVVAGEGLELDKSLVDVLREPLAQLVRNAVDHGIEAPAEREAAGKPRRGRVEVGARVDGEHVKVRIRDDGRGLDPELLREAARLRGIEPPADDHAALEVIFEPGFSTRPNATAVSGRGVGLDVVASAVRAVRGDVRVSSVKGQGTVFDLVLPATQYGLRALVARDAGQAFAFAAADVERVVRLEGARTAVSGGRPVLLAGEPAPLVPLAPAVGIGDGGARKRRMAVVLGGARGRAAFAVEEVVTEQELGLEPLGPRFSGVPIAGGVAVLASGELALVLASRELVAAAVGAATSDGAAPAPERAPARRRILIADDSATTRTLGRSILESAGYEVLAAADGEQAWSLLDKSGADLVVSDVEMPRMDGFQLTRAIRRSARFERVPVVLLTALASDHDRRRGLEVGADAYLVKSAFDQRVLLETVAELLEGKS